MKNNMTILRLLSSTIILGFMLSGCNDSNILDTFSHHDAQDKQQVEKKSRQENQIIAKQLILTNLQQLIQDKTTPFIGPVDAKVNVIEFFDYQCMYCSKLAGPLKQIESKYNNVKFLFKETPILAYRWKASKYAADIGNWIYQQKGSSAYIKYHDSIFASGLDEGKLTKDDVNKIATNVGVNVSKFTSNNTAANNFELFKKLGLHGTPALIVIPSKNVTTNNIHIINDGNTNALINAINKLQHSTADK